MPVMENCRLKVSSIVHGIASFVNQLMEMIVGLKVEQGIHGAGPVVRNDFEIDAVEIGKRLSVFALGPIILVTHELHRLTVIP